MEKQYKKVDVVNSSSYRRRLLPATPLGKHDYISKYKFNLTFESTDKAGYITEKALDPFFAYTVPVYFGNNQTFYNDFEYDDGLLLNGKTYQEVIDYMAYLDTHDDAYLSLIDKYFKLDKIDRRAHEYIERFSSFLERTINAI